MSSECWDCLGLYHDHYPAKNDKCFLYGCYFDANINGVTTDELYSKCPKRRDD